MSRISEAIRYTAQEAYRAWRRYWELSNGVNPDVCPW